MPDRLNEENRLLFDTLEHVWHTEAENIKTSWKKEALRVLFVTLLSVGLGVGIATGVLMSTRAALANTAALMADLHQQVEINRRMNRDQEEERKLADQRYSILMNRFQLLERELKLRKR